MKITKRQLKRIIKEELDRIDPDAAPGESVFRHVQRKAQRALRSADFELHDAPDMELVIVSKRPFTRDQVDALNDEFEDGSNASYGFHTGLVQ